MVPPLQHRPSHRPAIVLVLALGVGIAGCGLPNIPAPGGSAKSSAPAGSLPSVRGQTPPHVPDDVTPEHAAESTTGSRLTDTLHDQIASSPLMQDGEINSSLFQSLDRAGSLLADAKSRNREALKRLNRQTRLGRDRSVPDLILITVDRLTWKDLPSLSADPETEAAENSGWEKFARSARHYPQHYAGGTTPEIGLWTLLSGLNSGRISRSAERPYAVDASSAVLPRVLWQAGYDTACIGLWTETMPPLELGFDHWSGFRKPETLRSYPTVFWSDRSETALAENADHARGIRIDTLLASEAVSLLEAPSSSSRPRFLWIRLPESVEEPGEHTLAADALLDTVLGHIQTRLAVNGRLERTAIMLTGLAGRPDAQRPFRDESLRTPLLIAWKGQIPEGSRSELVTASYDLLPTCLELARASRRPAARDGRTIWPEQPASSPDRLLFWEEFQPAHVQAARKGAWKIIATEHPRQTSLYDLTHDPEEQRDVAETHPEIVKSFAPGQTARSRSN